MSDFIYHPDIKLADGKTPIIVAIDPDEIRVHRCESDKQSIWTLDKNLKPISFANTDQRFYVYSGGTFEQMQAYEQTSAGHEKLVSRKEGGIDMLPSVMGQVLAASKKPGFPKEFADKIPAAFTSLALTMPSPMNPPGT